MKKGFQKKKAWTESGRRAGTIKKKAEFSEKKN
jgi:hypothetical protein